MNHAQTNRRLRGGAQGVWSEEAQKWLEALLPKPKVSQQRRASKSPTRSPTNQEPNQNRNQEPMDVDSLKAALKDKEEDFESIFSAVRVRQKDLEQAQ
eukprot:Skav200091  [mRNA]  locus=scaffold694:218690:219089:- [translate_table: standard]